MILLCKQRYKFIQTVNPKLDKYGRAEGTQCLIKKYTRKVLRKTENFLKILE